MDQELIWVNNLTGTCPAQPLHIKPPFSFSWICAQSGQKYTMWKKHYLAQKKADGPAAINIWETSVVQRPGVCVRNHVSYFSLSFWFAANWLCSNAGRYKPGQSCTWTQILEVLGFLKLFYHSIAKVAEDFLCSSFLKQRPLSSFPQLVMADFWPSTLKRILK